MGATIEGHGGLTGGRWFGRGVLRVLIVAGLLGFCPAGPRAETEPLREDFKAAEDLMREGNCQGVWDIFWPLIQEKDFEATATMMVVMAYSGFFPPMPFPWKEKWPQFLGAFAVLSIPFDDGKRDFVSVSAFRSQTLDWIWPETDPDRSRCVVEAPPLDCMDIAFDRGFAPTLAEVSAMVEEGRQNGFRAFCPHLLPGGFKFH